MNQQREVIYKQRRDLLTGVDLKSTIEDIMMESAEAIGAKFADERALPVEWDWEAISDAVFQQFNFRLPKMDENTLDGLTEEGLIQEIYDQAHAIYDKKAAMLGSGDDFRQLERMVMLQTVDNLWKDHLLSMDHLKEGIGLRGYAQQNPLLVYKKEGFEMFQETIDRIKAETLGILFRIQLAQPDHIDELQKPKEQKLIFSGGGDSPAIKKPVKRESEKIGRNDPCPCGSGKKYKKCCGR
jgi:preprotein translocase subunit SecA